MRIAVATPSRPALSAAFVAASLGGGAVDAAVAAAAVAMVTEVGICSPGSGGFLTVTDSDSTVSYDGYMAVPGLDPSAAPRPQATEVTMAYGGGITTMVGPGSIATPGIWAGLEAAHADHGRVAWADLLRPAIDLARSGFVLGSASLIYLRHSHHLVYGHDAASSVAIHNSDGTLRTAGEEIRMPDLATSLEALALEGAAAIHGGDLGRRMIDDLRARGARMTWSDLVQYRAQRKPPLTHRYGPWAIATNPSPAIGGEALIGVLDALHAKGTGVSSQVAAQMEIFERQIARDAGRSGSTIHISAVDEIGTACAITASSGYGSGVIPSGTGIWMNNALGEQELVPDPSSLVPGMRLVSNMAPTICRHDDGTVLAVGSPGAARITSALAQVLSAYLFDGLTIENAVARPRLHVEIEPTASVSVEPGLDVGDLGVPVDPFPERHMYFGGVGAALKHSTGELEAVADPRREGAAGVSG